MDKGEVVDLSYLGVGGVAESCGEVAICGGVYELRGVSVVEDFLVVLATVEEVLAAGELAAGVGPAEFLAKRGEVVERLHSMIRRLVPGIAVGVLVAEFGTLASAQGLVLALLELVRERAPAGVKKNLGGVSGEKPRTAGTAGTAGTGAADQVDQAGEAMGGMGSMGVMGSMEGAVTATVMRDAGAGGGRNVMEVMVEPGSGPIG